MHCVPAGRVSLGKNASLRLERLQLDDQGWYDCRVLLLDRPSDELRNSSWTLLSVSGEVLLTELCFFKADYGEQHKKKDQSSHKQVGCTFGPHNCFHQFCQSNTKVMINYFIFPHWFCYILPELTRLWLVIKAQCIFVASSCFETLTEKK